MMMLKDLARISGVSQACISLVRKGRHGVSDETRARIQQLLTDHGYSYTEYDPQTKQPVGKPAVSAPSTNTIQLLTYKRHAMLVDGNDGFVSAIIDALDLEARQLGYQLLVSVIGPGNNESVMRAAASISSDGMLVIATEMSQYELSIFEAVPLPLVIIDSDFISSPYSCVTMNNRELAFSAVLHLHALGHRHIGYLCSSVPTGNFRSRTQGYHEALDIIGQPYEKQWCYSLRPTLNAAYHDMLAQLREKRPLPTAFFADNDIIAIGAMKALSEVGCKIPSDISVIGVDNIPFGSVSMPPLSTMSISCHEIGSWAVRMLMQAIANPGAPKTKIQIGASLVQRKSTAPPADR